MDYPDGFCRTWQPTGYKDERTHRWCIFWVAEQGVLEASACGITLNQDKLISAFCLSAWNKIMKVEKNKVRSLIKISFFWGDSWFESGELEKTKQ